jgi:DNA repair protein RadC
MIRKENAADPTSDRAAIHDPTAPRRILREPATSAGASQPQRPAGAKNRHSCPCSHRERLSLVPRDLDQEPAAATESGPKSPDCPGAGHQHLTWILRDGTDPARSARALLDEFGHLARVLNGSAARQLRATGDIATVRSLAQFRAAALFAAHARIAEGTIFACWSDFIAYLRLEIAHDPYEQFHVTFLNLRNELILSERVASGTIDECQVPFRHIIARAIEIGAAALILAHNHPTGLTDPSMADRDITRRLALCGKQLNLAIFDHIIVGRNGHTSFRDLGLV